MACAEKLCSLMSKSLLPKNSASFCVGRRNDYDINILKKKSVLTHSITEMIKVKRDGNVPKESI